MNKFLIFGIDKSINALPLCKNENFFECSISDEKLAFFEIKLLEASLAKLNKQRVQMKSVFDSNSKLSFSTNLVAETSFASTISFLIKFNFDKTL